MFNLLLIYDDLDDSRGDYFYASHQHFTNKLNDLNPLNLQSLNTNSCTTNAIESYIHNFNGQPFIFVAYAHGSEDTLYIGGEHYIHEANAYYFSETLFYACSCLSAKRLGLRLKEEGCRIFVGYDAHISSLDPECEPIFFECENAFLIHFLTTNSTIDESLKFMYRKYEEMKTHLSVNYGVFTSSILESNLNSFKIFCDDEDRELTKLNFSL